MLQRIADALEVTTDELFLVAGIKPSQDREADLRWREMERVFCTLPAGRQHELLAIARTLASLAPRATAPEPKAEGAA